MPDRDRVALFIDGSNLYAASKSLGFDIDYKRQADEFIDLSHLTARVGRDVAPTSALDGDA